MFGVLSAPGGIELNAKEMALAYGIGALVFWTVVSYFSGAGALGAFVAFGALIYCWHWIPNRTTNFLNDVPGVTTGMIEGSKQYTLNGVVPILAVISLVYAIQLIVRSVQSRRRERVEAARLQGEQEAAQAQQEADAEALYPVAASTYPAQYGDSYENRSRFDDLFDEDPEPVRPRNQADEQTSQFPTTGQENTAQFPGTDDDAQGNYPGEDTVLVPTDRDETVQVPSTPEPQQEQTPEAAERQTPADEDDQVTQQAPADGDDQVTQVAPVAGGAQVATVDAAEQETQQVPVAETPADAGKQAEPEDKPEEPKTPPSAPPPAVAGGAGAAAAGGAKAASEQPAPAVKTEPEAPAAKGDAEAAPPVVKGEAGVPEAPKAADAPEAKSAAGGQAERGGTPPVPEVREQEAAPVPGVREQVGSQYRERMEDPEDTGEFFISAFENPPVINGPGQIRAAGA